MAENIEVNTEAKATDGGRILFADDVVATIASLAVADVEGVAGMSGTAMEGFSGILGGKKSLTKGVKVQVGTEEVTIDLSVLIQYGVRIQEVCQKIQLAVRNAIETMTGLKCTEVNVFVQSIVFEQPDKKKKDKAEELKPADAEAAAEAEAAEGKDKE